MTAADVIEVLGQLEEACVEVWLDGGWGIDALLGSQTREHSDLDLVVRQDELDDARDALVAMRFAHAPDEWPGLPARLVLRDGRGRQVDFHPIVIDEMGDGRQDLGDGRFGRYPAEGLRGDGLVGARRVRCLTAGLQLAHHRGYELAEHERRDLELLAGRLSLQ